MNPKIRTKDELISYLLYLNNHAIRVGKNGDVDIRDDLDPVFANKIVKLLDKV